MLVCFFCECVYLWGAGLTVKNNCVNVCVRVFMSGLFCNNQQLMEVGQQKKQETTSLYCMRT